MSQASPPPPPPPVSEHRIGDNAGIRMLLPVGRSRWAIAAGYVGLVSGGISGLACLYTGLTFAARYACPVLILVLAMIAIIFSILAIRDIKESKATDHPKHGMGRAIFGLVMGVIGMIVGVFIVMEALKEAALPHP